MMDDRPPEPSNDDLVALGSMPRDVVDMVIFAYEGLFLDWAEQNVSVGDIDWEAARNDAFRSIKNFPCEHLSVEYESQMKRTAMAALGPALDRLRRVFNLANSEKGSAEDDEPAG